MPKAGTEEVTFEDQQHINTFNRLFQQCKEAEAEAGANQSLVEALDDASNELMLCDEEQVRYVVGECFYHAPLEEAEAKVQQALDEAKAEVTSIGADIDGKKSKMAELKKVLYAKFGNSINLEE